MITCRGCTSPRRPRDAWLRKERRPIGQRAVLVTQTHKENVGDYSYIIYSPLFVSLYPSQASTSLYFSLLQAKKPPSSSHLRDNGKTIASMGLFTTLAPKDTSILGLVTFTATALFCGLFIFFLVKSVYRLWFHPLAKYPGPFLARISNIHQTWHAYTGERHLNLYQQHEKYGKCPTYLYCKAEDERGLTAA